MFSISFNAARRENLTRRVRMKVAQFCTFPYGGAATAVKRLHNRLIEQKVQSQFYFNRNLKSEISDPSFQKVKFSEPRYGIFSRRFQRRIEEKRQKKVYRQYVDHIALRPQNLETFSAAQLSNLSALNWQAIDCDVVHLHWISFFADYPTFFGSIPNRVPIVWTLHDMNPFTGGCHYSNGCTRFKQGCGMCNQITESSRLDISASGFRVKKKALRKKKVHVVAPSDWIRKLAMQSKIWPSGTSFQTIHNGIDLNEFHPIKKSLARKLLGIEGDAILIGFGAEDINNRRKGFHHLRSALTQLNSTREVECIVFGSGEIDPAAGLPPVHHFGYVDSPERQALIYSAADLVIVPSREDNQPQVGLEAMACGTPVVAFNAGGIPEYVRDGMTGLIAQLGNESHLARRMQWLIENDQARRVMGERARLMMEEEFELGQQTERYRLLYENLAQANPLRRAA